MDKVLVLGATGDQGQPLLRKLAAAGIAVRAGTRDPADFPRDAFPDAEPVAVDFADQASLDAAAQGCAGIVMHLPFTFDRAVATTMGRNIAAAAARAKVGKIVFHTSCVVMDEDLGIGGHDGRRDIERELSGVGVPYVFIRSAVFMNNMVRVWVKPAILKHGVFAYPCRPDLGISWISLDDVADYMVAAYLHPDLMADRLTVGGPEVLTGAEVAARLTTALGRPIRFENLEPDAFARAMSKLVTGSEEVPPGSIYDGMAAFYRWYNRCDESPLAIDLRPVLARLAVRPTPLLVWAGAQDWTG